MTKKRSDLENQRVAKAAIKSTRKTTIKKPAKPSRKEHFKKSTKIIITNAKIQSNLFITNDKILSKIIIGNEKSCL